MNKREEKQPRKEEEPDHPIPVPPGAEPPKPLHAPPAEQKEPVEELPQNPKQYVSDL